LSLIVSGDAKDTLLELAEEKAQYDIVFIDVNKDGYVDCFKVIFTPFAFANDQFL
jgi:predicted O-methyltransferase YrrM